MQKNLVFPPLNFGYRTDQRLSLVALRIDAEAHPDCAGLKCSGTFMGQRRAVKSRPNSDSLLSQKPCHFLTVHIRQEGNRPRLMLPREHPDIQIFQ